MSELDPVSAQEFSAEVIEHVDASEQVLVRAGTEELAKDDINLLFRSFHSIKGLARVIGYTGLERLAHVAESLLATVRDGRRELDQAVQNLLLRTLDGVREARSSLSDGTGFKADAALVEALESAANGVSVGDAAEVGRDERGADLYFDNETLVALTELFDELLPAIAAAAAETDAISPLGTTGPQLVTDQVVEDIKTLEYAAGKVGFGALSRDLCCLLNQSRPADLARCLYRAARLEYLIEHPCGVAEATRISRPWLSAALLQAIGEQRWTDAGCILRCVIPDSPFVSLLLQLRGGDYSEQTRQASISMLTEALSAELMPGAPSTAGLSSIAADKVQELLAGACQVSDAERKPVDLRKLDLKRFSTLPPATRKRLQDAATRPQADFFEIVVEHPAKTDVLVAFGRHLCTSLDPLFTESLAVDGVRCLAILVISDLPEEQLRERVLTAEWSPSLLKVVKLDGRQAKTHFGVTAQETPDAGGSGIQVRVPVAVLDSMFGRFGQFFGVFTRFNALVVDTEVPEILRELSDFAVLNAPQLIAKVDRLIRQQNDFAVIEAEAHRLHSVIHETTLGFRVIPLDTLFSRFPRMVRDTAQKQGKMVRFEIHSKGIRVDNGMLELLSDPLMHMLRNCIDHGIEMPDERERTAKSRTAVLSLSAEQRGNRILIEVGDDGRGIDIDRVLEKAVANHLVDAATAATLTEEQIARFIFSPGFSTAAKITDTSGRGVGMDVALVNVTKLGGKIEIASRRGKGTTFSIDIPLSKAIQSMLLAETGVQYVAFPDHIVVEGVVGSKEEIQYVNGQRSILLHDRFLPLFKLVDLLQLAAPEDDGADELSIVVCELKGRRLGIEVRRILRRSDLLIREMHPRLAKLPGVGGISTIGTDKIVIAVDPEGLFDLARRHAVFGLRTHEDRVAVGSF